MAEARQDERIAIASVTRNHKTYGTTSKYQKKRECFIKHCVQKDDTLQGIALKHSVTMEQIRRVNKLWANDSLFLREYLLVPVPMDSLPSNYPPEDVEIKLVSPSSEENSPNGHCSSGGGGGGSESEQEPPCSEPGRSWETDLGLSATCGEHMTIPGDDKSEQSVMDYLVKMDNDIAKTRRRVEKMEKKQTPREQEKCTLHQCRPTPYSSSCCQGHSTQDANPTVMTQGRKVQTSLRQHEKRQEEMFEL